MDDNGARDGLGRTCPPGRCGDGPQTARPRRRRERDGFHEFHSPALGNGPARPVQHADRLRGRRERLVDPWRKPAPSRGDARFVRDAQRLAALGADLNIRGHDGQTPLMLAKGRNYCQMIHAAVASWARPITIPAYRIASPPLPLVVQDTTQTTSTARGATPMSQDVSMWARSQDVITRPMSQDVSTMSVSDVVVTWPALCLGWRHDPKASHGRKD